MSLQIPINFTPAIDETLSALDGVPLRYSEWRPSAHHSGSSRLAGAVLLVHGYAESLTRYRWLAQSLAEEGFVVGGSDQRGMGDSGGERVLIYDYEEYLHDLDISLTRLRRDLPPDLPCFVYGHSMGGLIALLHAARRQSDPVAGTILSGPLLGVAMPIPGWQVTLGRLAVRSFPRLRVPTRLDTNLLTQDEADRAALAADKQRIRFVTLSWFFASGRAMEEAKKEAARIVWPTLWLIGGDDRICCAETSRRIFQSLPDFGDHLWREYPGLYHEVHNERETDRRRVLSDLLDWLRPRCLSAEAAVPNASAGVHVEG